jgi:hypothetical protein
MSAQVQLDDTGAQVNWSVRENTTWTDDFTATLTATGAAIDITNITITAEVTAALVLLESPAELISAIFDDPAQALLAIASIGADMSEEEREESEKIIVASVIAGQAAVTAAGMAASSTTRTPSGGGSTGGGGAASGREGKSVRRRKP